MWGGIAVYLALVLGLFVARWLLPGMETLGELSTAVMLASGFVCLLGCVDDSWDLNGRFKLLLQIISVLPIVASGYYVDRVVAFGVPIHFGWLGVPLTVLWLVGCVNALNLLDGMDGLASVVGLSAAIIMAIIAATDGHPEVATVAMVLAGALAGFLAYNLPPASIYLGDSGSMVIGLVAGIISMQGALKTTATLSLTVPAVVMSVPMLDTALAIVRRRLTGQPFDAADRGHIHHRLLDRGLSTWQALCVIGSLCLATGAAATAATILRVEALAWVTALGLFMLLVRTRAFGHHEFFLVSRVLTERLSDGLRVLAALIGGDGRRRLNAAAARPFDEGWPMLADEMAFCGADRLDLSLRRGSESLASRTWVSPALSSDMDSAWTVSLRFTGPGDVDCELRIAGWRTTAAGPSRLSRATRTLTAFGSHWAKHPEQIPRTPDAADVAATISADTARIAA